ncbi:hypothetical protein NQ016_04005 [Staphylococcus hyicus]|uniref:hypothetical protein n=1 Tax=Staphylococcus hyicus TaxID=1284 RepID=UPI00211C97BF|nr:hypothetical protein [Staphylococcus hyicus]MCQ9290682.1 hypothetical protein [Staphylococcus hyicus]MCQ9305924.1 hypothetical protein [Staphylococcus hyicus]MCQ9308336.1 hypothetical protein [Staphylococcus hyicus]MCQ9310758.1 hypothetical protein [Staphylococcus hyicus]
MKNERMLLILVIKRMLKINLKSMFNIAKVKLHKLIKAKKNESKNNDIYDLYYNGDISVAELQKLEDKIFKARKASLKGGNNE